LEQDDEKLEQVEEIETENEEEEEDEEEEEELFEIEIDDITYYVSNEENGPIYEIGEGGEVGKEIGKMVDSEAIFN
jgi:hypothetical protein